MKIRGRLELSPQKLLREIVPDAELAEWAHTIRVLHEVGWEPQFVHTVLEKIAEIARLERDAGRGFFVRVGEKRLRVNVFLESEPLIGAEPKLERKLSRRRING